MKQFKKTLIFGSALLISLLIALFLIPVLLVAALILGLLTTFFIARNRRPPKGTVEILPAEEKKMSGTSEVEIEIEVENLKKDQKKETHIEPRPPSKSA